MKQSADPRPSTPSRPSLGQRVAQSLRIWLGGPRASELAPVPSPVAASPVVRRTRAGDEYRL